jgi:hypothetical protein
VHGKQTDEDPERWRKSQEDGAAQPAAASPAGLSASPLGAPNARPDGQTRPERPAAAEQLPPAATAPDDPPAKPAAAHDIQLQVGGQGDSRIEVRVTERAGDVHVSVSTPDTRLAGELREDLPALASRLEQSGFRAETWHPAAGGDRQHPYEPPAGAAAQDAGSQSRQNGRDGQRDPQQQERRNREHPDTPSQRKEQGKDFAWLLSSLR